MAEKCVTLRNLKDKIAFSDQKIYFFCLKALAKRDGICYNEYQEMNSLLETARCREREEKRYMMQKRTNPLELKVENRAARAEVVKTAPVEEPVLEVAPKAEEPKVEEIVKSPVVAEPEQKTVADVAPEIKETAAEDKPVVAKKPTLSKRPPVAKIAPEPEIAPAESEIEETPAKAEYTVERVAPASSMGGALQWQMVSSRKKVEAVPPVVEVKEEPVTAVPVYEPAPAVAEPEISYDEEDEVATADDILEDDILEGDQETVTEPAIELEDEIYEDDDMPEPESSISDEEEPLVIEDYEMAARFGLCGRVSRGMKIGKLSKDLCRLAQLMHPNESLSSIIEGALLTRIYLENRDAFDAMVEMLEKKGGHIKC